MDKIAKWYHGLDRLEQIIIQEHVCATDPTPLDTLASDLHTFRHVVHRRLNDLPQSLQDVIEEDAALRRAVSDVEREIACPVFEEDLISRYAWLAEGVTDGGALAVIDLLCGLTWPGSRKGGWVFDGDIEREQQKTQAALAMEPGGTMTLGTAARLLREAGVRVGPEHSRLRRWLARSGLLVTTHQVVAPLSPDPNGNNCVASQPLISRDTAPAPVDVVADPPEHPTLPAQSASDPLWEALDRLRTVAVEEGMVGNLGALLLKAEHLQGELHQLAHQVSGAYVGEDRWRLGAGKPGIPVPAMNRSECPLALAPDVMPVVRTDDVEVISTSADHVKQMPTRDIESGSDVSGGDTDLPAEGMMVMDAVEVALREVGHPLSTPDLRQRCSPARRLTRLRRELDADVRFRRSDRDTWALSEWNLPVYKPLWELIADMVDEAGGAVPSHEVIKKLTRDFTVKESSVRQSMSSAPFTSRGGVVRRLADVEEQGELWGRTASSRAGTDDDVPSALELMKDMGLDF